MNKLRYPIGEQDFRSLIEGGYVYVDKTRYISQLRDMGKFFFLSRPRRFGKSLFLSTLEAYFKGEKNLFKGLQIYNYEKAWNTYEVLHLDLNSGSYDYPNGLYNILNEALCRWEAKYGKNSAEIDLGLRFGGVIQRACELSGRKVVILIDEYDKPLLQAIGNIRLTETFRNHIKPFLAALKTKSACIEFCFLTGVTKMGKLSVFSDLNQLKDISLSSDFAAICGITMDDLHQYFDESIADLANANNLSVDATVEKLKQDYDGYRFSKNKTLVFNPFSLLNVFQDRDFRTYWFETGTPSYLVKLLRDSDYLLPDLDHLEVPESQLSNIDYDFADPIPTIYQSGYLTIKDFDPEFSLYHLGYPNREVREGFLRYLLPYYTSVKTSESAKEISKLVMAIKSGGSQNH